MSDYNKMMDALEAMGKRVDRSGFADRMSDPDFAERVRQQLATKYSVQDSASFYNTYKPETKLPEVPKDTVSDYSFIGFAEPTTRAKAEAYAKANNPETFAEYDKQSEADKELANERARQYGDEGGNAYTLARGMISLPVGALLGGLNTLWSKYVEPPHPSNPDYGKTVTDYMKEESTKGAKGEGLAGFISEPTNLAFLAPGLGESAVRMAYNPVKDAVWANRAVRAGGGALEGAGYTALSNAGRIEPESPVEGGMSAGTQYALGAGLGGLFGLTGSTLRQAGRERFPGVFQGNPRSVDASGRALLRANLDDILDRGVLPKGKYGFEQMADEETAKLGRVYDKAIEAATPFTYAKSGDNSKLYLEKAFADLARPDLSDEERKVAESIIKNGGKGVGHNVDNPTEAYHVYGARGQEEIPSSMLPTGTQEPALFPMSDIREEVAKRYKDKLAASDILSDKNLKKLDKAQESALSSIRHRQEIESSVKQYLGLPEDAPTSQIASALDEYAKIDPDGADKLAKVWTNPVYEAREVSTFRNNMNDPTMYRDVTKSGEAQLAKRHLATSYRDAINDMLDADQRYAQFVTPEVRKHYALFKSLGDIVDAPGSIGLTSRLPWGQAISPWRTASMYYKGGKMLERGAPLAPQLVNGLSTLFGAVEAKKQEKSK